MKKGDVVTIKDYSWARTIVDGVLKHYNNCKNPTAKYVVVEIDCAFPLECGGCAQPNAYRNNTIIQAVGSDKMVFIHNTFLKSVKPQYVWKTDRSKKNFNLETRKMFEIKSYGTVYHIKNQLDEYLHSDGSIYRTIEYWPTEELAQIVLDKYQPLYVWKHGDLAISLGGRKRIFIKVKGKLRIYAGGFGEICPHSESAQQWAKDFGYKKIINIFE